MSEDRPTLIGQGNGRERSKSFIDIPQPRRCYFALNFLEEGDRSVLKHYQNIIIIKKLHFKAT